MACSSRSSSPRRSTATSSSPASAVFAPPRQPASSGSRPSCGSLPIAISSSSRSSRTSSARISIPIETADAYRQLIDDFGFSQDEVATRVGRARSTVANTLRLLDLAPGVQAAVADGRLSEGHGRALGGLAPELQDRVLDSVIGQELSVRQTEELVRRLREPRPEPAGPPAAPRRPGPRARRGGPAPGARHEGEPRPLAAGRPHRHRVLQRRRARASLRAPDRRDRVTEEATRPTSPKPRCPKPPTTRGSAPRVAEASAHVRLGLHRGQHPGPRGSRGRPPAARHVHRVYRGRGLHHLV